MNNRLPMTLEHKYIDFFIWICIIISLVLNLSARYIDGFAQWYVANIYPIFPTVIGRIYSLLNFSFFEAGLIFFALLICIYLLKGLCLILINDSRKKSFLSSGVRVLLLVSAGLIMMYTLFCSINYQRHDIGEILQLPNNEISGDNLEKLSLILADDLMILIKDEDWKENLKLMHDKDYIESESVNAMKQLAFIEPSFSGYYPRVKAIYNSDILTRFGIEGFFSPYTMEANYNSEMAPFLLPYTICHELAHLKGYMRENDAGFISYLACKILHLKFFNIAAHLKHLLIPCKH